MFAIIPRAADFRASPGGLMRDVVASLTVAVVALPLALGFGLTSGMSAAAGLTTAIIAGFLAALLGGSRYQVSGPTGAMTVVLIPIIHLYGTQAIPLLGLLAGAMVVLMGFARLGGVINRIPDSVVEGFTVGIACVIALQQLPLALGIPKGAGEQSMVVAFNTLHDAIVQGVDWQTVAMVALTLLVKFRPRAGPPVEISRACSAQFCSDFGGAAGGTDRPDPYQLYRRYSARNRPLARRGSRAGQHQPFGMARVFDRAVVRHRVTLVSPRGRQHGGRHQRRTL